MKQITSTCIQFVMPAMLLLCGLTICDSTSIAQDKLKINMGSNRSNFDLQGLVRYLAEEKGLKIYADDSQILTKNNSVIFFGENIEVEPERMFEIVQSILRSNGFAIVKADTPGWSRIVPLERIRPFTDQAKPGEAQGLPPANYVTGVFTLKNISSQQAENYLKQVIAGSAGDSKLNITTIPNSNMVIITETARRLDMMEQVLGRIDVPISKTIREFYRPKHIPAKQLEAQINSILSQVGLDLQSDKNQQRPNENQFIISASKARVIVIDQTNQLMLIGPRGQIDEIRDLLDQLDVSNSQDASTTKYDLKYISAKRIDELVRQTLIGLDEAASKEAYQSSVDETSNRIIVTAVPSVHRRIESLIEQLDVESNKAKAQSPVEFYTLKNVKAVDILDTLQSVVGRVRSSQDRGTNRGTRFRQSQGTRGVSTRDGFDVNGPNRFNDTAEGPIEAPPFLQDTNDSPFENFGGSARGASGLDFGGSVLGDFARLANEFNQVENIIPGDASVSVDENTNTLIVIADPSVQRLYAQLIQKLDVRRPQVLIEVNVVTISGQDDFNLGVEVSGGDRTGAKKLFSFTSFGLSEVDAATGALSIIPGLGFNGTLVDPETADVVLRALARHRRSRVIAAPRILVNDNATGLISSIAEVPFSSINASNTVSTTSFAGFAQAGTTISVAPQISDDDFLNLEFDILVNNFVGAASSELPPPRNTDQVTSEVSIPDGHTVIVGGLTRKRLAEELQGLPIIERIPVLNRLTSNETKEAEEQRLFVFIKPIILRDDQFKDLRFLSDRERREACIPDDFPSSKPVLLR